MEAYCEACVEKWHPSWLERRNPPKPCEAGCGVLVSYWGYVNRSCCSSYCSEIARNIRRRKARATVCEECGAGFTPSRSDGRYCSPAHRQKAYRKRKAGA